MAGHSFYLEKFFFQQVFEKQGMQSVVQDIIMTGAGWLLQLRFQGNQYLNQGESAVSRTRGWYRWATIAAGQVYAFA
jgi:hypothetical protein